MKSSKQCPDQFLKQKQLEEMQRKYKDSAIQPAPKRQAKVTPEMISTSYPQGVVVTNRRAMGVKKLDPRAIVPTKNHSADAGYDLYALEGTVLEKHTHKLIKTGISVDIPKGYVGLVWPRSGLAYKSGLDVFAGVIDSGYTGDVGVILYNSQYTDYHVNAGDRIAQIVFQKVEDFELVEVSDLNDSVRGTGGFGSSGT